jgi:ubiquinone/menaquinone biosynthesis C-methylase UbiE
MIERTPEPDLMNDIAQAEAYAETDFSEPHDAFVALFADRFPDFRGGSVLDLGCGTADVIIRFAHAFPSSYITGIDGAQEMLNIGSRDVARAGLKEQIKLQKCILPDNELSGSRYNAVISNSLLHHLKDPFVMWNMIKNCAKENAPVFVMDLMRPDNKETAEQIVQQHAEGAPDILRKDFYNSLLASYTVDEVREQLSIAGLALSVEAVSDRHLIVWGSKQ